MDKSEIKYQTSVKKSSSNPSFDESFELSLATYQVALAKLIICVYSKKILSGRSLIGCIIFDEEHEDYLSHLREAISNDGENVVKWHTLI